MTYGDLSGLAGAPVFDAFCCPDGILKTLQGRRGHTAPVRLPAACQLSLCRKQLAQPEEQRQPLRVLRQPPLAHLAISIQPLQSQEGMLPPDRGRGQAPSSHRRLRLLRLPLLTLRLQLSPPPQTHRHPPFHLQVLILLPLANPLIPSITPYHRLSPAQQIVRLRDVMGIGRRGAQAVDYSRLRVHCPELAEGCAPSSRSATDFPSWSGASPGPAP